MSYLAGESVPPRDWKIVPCRRLALNDAWRIYQNNYYRNLQKSLSQTYEACFALLTTKIFEKLSYAFIQQHPLKQSDLALYGKEFPDFLQNCHTIVSSWPFLPELAKMENLIKKLFLHGRNSEEMKVTYPVHQIWKSLLHDEEEIEDLEGKKILTIHKNDKNYIFFDLVELG